MQFQSDNYNYNVRRSSIQKSLKGCTCHVSLHVLLDALMVMPLCFYEQTVANPACLWILDILIHSFYTSTIVYLMA